MKRILMVNGKQGAGKTTNVEEIVKVLPPLGYHVRIFKFADPLYAMHDALLPLLKLWGFRPEDMKKDGDLLQVLGTEYIRKHLGVDVLALDCRRRIEEFLADDPNGSRLAIVDDLRFENEFDLLDGYRVRLEAPEAMRKARCTYWRENTTHESEIGLDAYAADGRFDLRVSTENARSEVTALSIRVAWFNDERNHGMFRRGALKEAPALERSSP